MKDPWQGLSWEERRALDDMTGGLVTLAESIAHIGKAARRTSAALTAFGEIGERAMPRKPSRFYPKRSTRSMKGK